MLKSGDILGNRYEIYERIGTGGMAYVYKGKDHKLNRYIAIKVLKEEYSKDKSFVDKFKVEAQSAAGLMHQNIVNVYDVGEEDGIYYFVMELVEGITLKNYIDKKLRLSVKEALSIAIQVANGIEAAHNNGIIHRDIKPQNIIISREGKVKVADFGIARAASSDTITSHAMGSVHYTSPEQARGGYSDAKSDIYSIGITLFEMVTGRVPFDGETTVSIAIKHIQEEMPSPRMYVPDVPISVERIIQKCTQKSPDRRYYNMSELIKDLKQALITPDDDFVEIHDARSNAGTKVITADEVKASKNNTQYQNNQYSGQQSGQYNDSQYQNNQYSDSQYRDQYNQPYSGNGVQQNEYAQGGYNPYDDDDGYDDGRLNGIPNSPNRSDRSDRSDRNERYVQQVDANQYYAYDDEDDRERRTKKKKQKNSGRTNDRASNQYNDRRNSRNNMNDDDIDDIDKGMEKVMTTLLVVAAVVVAIVAVFAVGKVVGLFGKSPSKATVKEGYTLVPNVVGLDINSATKALEEAGLKAKASYAESTEYDRDIIASQDPLEGTEVEKGSSLTLVISSGKVAGAAGGPQISVSGEGGSGEIDENTPSSNVPDVVGRTEAEARVLIENEGFELIKELVASESVEKGKVVSQSPLGATRAPIGSGITVYISDGTDVSEVVVPDLVGKSKDEAQVLLDEAHLRYETISEENSDSVPAGSVISQSVTAGATVAENSVVNFTVSKGGVGYSCSLSIEAPSDYLEGTEAIIVLVDPAGNQIESVSTSTFPYSLVKTGIQGTNAGVLTVTYQKVDGTWDTTAPIAVTFKQE